MTDGNDDNDSLTQWNQFAHDTLSTRFTPEQIQEIKVTPTPEERRAQERATAAAAAAKDWRPLTNDELREKRAGIVRESLDLYHPGHDYTEEDIKTWL
jgi:hypothetical protein